ncbi:MAG: SH3 domain-containing protein [bacterium]
MFRKSFFVMLIPLFILNGQSCQNEEPEKTPAPISKPQLTEIPSVCIWEGAALRAKPSRKKGKWLAAIALGEQVTWLGSSEVDSSDENRKFYKIRLSDGKEGWASSYVIITDSKPAAITKKAFIYRRPELLTMTDQTFDSKEMVAIIKSENDWFEVIGAQRKKSGWMKNEGISLNKEDVAVAILVTKALAEKDPQKQREMIEAILNNSALKNSVFVPELQQMSQFNRITPENTVPDST